MNISAKYIDGTNFIYPEVLYKYRDWRNPNHKRIIINNCVFLSSPRGFEDIYDCKVPESFPLKSELYKLFLQKSIEESINFTRQQHKKYARYWCKHSPLADPVRLKSEIKNVNTIFNNRFGVLSLSKNPNNDRMWDKYGNKHEGICIGFDSTKLFDIVGGGGEVIYVDELPVIDFMNDNFGTKHIKNIFFKEKKWAFEKEYRLHKMWDRDISDFERNIALQDDTIVEVILGKRNNDKDCEEITELVNRLHPKAIIKKQLIR